MTFAGWTLQRAIHSALASDPDLLALLGGAKIFDDVPRRTARPFVTFGVTRERDWSTISDAGSEHDITIKTWSEGRGREQAQAIGAAIHAVLHDADLSLDGHRLINLRQTSGELRRERDGKTWHGLIRFRAVTEVAV